MKKMFPILLALLLLAGCRIDAELRPDTIVDIPLKPVETVTEATQPTTEPPTEVPTDPPTEPPTEKQTEKSKKKVKKSSTKKTSAKKKASTKKKNSTKATEAPTPTLPPTEPPTEAPTRPSVSSYTPTKLDKAIAEAINDRRKEAGLPELSTSKKLSAAAAQRACELPLSWSHSRPDGSDFATVLAEFGLDSSACTENLYYTTGSAKSGEILSKWMDSDSHRENILSEDMDTIGIATCTADGVTYIAALFIG